KNKLAPPFQEAEFDIRWGLGIDRVAELLEIGQAAGLIRKAGAHLSFEGEALGQGKERARSFLLEKPEMMKKLVDRLHSGPSIARATDDLAPQPSNQSAA